MVATLPLETVSTLTDRYQTTVPATVRKALHLGKRDKIQFSIEPDGRVVLSRAEASDEDMVLASFLSFLARDIGNNPELIQSLSPALVDQLGALVGDVDVDLDAPLLDEDE